MDDYATSFTRSTEGRRVFSQNFLRAFALHLGFSLGFFALVVMVYRTVHTDY